MVYDVCESAMLFQVVYKLVLMMIIALFFQQNVRCRHALNHEVVDLPCLFCESIASTRQSVVGLPHIELLA